MNNCQMWYIQYGVNLLHRIQSSPRLGVLGQGYVPFCWGFVDNNTGATSHYVVYAVNLDFALQLIRNSVPSFGFDCMPLDNGLYGMISGQFPNQSMYLFQKMN